MPSVFGAGGAVPLSGMGMYLSGMGMYLSGSAPILGTTVPPQTYMPFNGATGTSDDHGNWDQDSMGLDPWTDNYS